MAEYQQHPDSEPRGRHAGRRAPQGSRPGAQAQPSGAQPGYRPANAPVPQAQGAYRPVSTAPRPPAQAGAYRPVQPNVGHGAGRHSSGGGRGSQNGAPRRKGGVWRVVFWIALVVFVVAVVALGAIAFSYWQGQQTYNQVAEEGFTPPADIEGTSLADITVDWDALKAINPDTVGWIYIPGTVVNYPIVQTTDNEKYLTHDFQGSEGWIATFGAIFLAAENASDFSDANNIVYGHHLNDGSMFACLAGFDNVADFEAHRTVYILTPQGNFKLRTFSLVHVAADDPLAQTAFADKAEQTAYIQDKIDRSEVKPTDIPAAADLTQTFAFATCDNLPSDGRYVLYSYIEDTTVANASAFGAGADGADAGTDADAGLADPDAVAAVDEAANEAVS